MKADPISCEDCESCATANARKQNRKVHELERVENFKNLFKRFISENRLTYGDGVYLNVPLLELAVISYFDDIYRFKDYSGSEYADRHKQAAYTIKWLSKIKPIQILPQTEVTSNVIYVNAAFALYAGLTFLDPNVSRCISEKYIKHLLYTCLYRNWSGRNLASTLYVIERFARKEKDI